MCGVAMCFQDSDCQPARIQALLLEHAMRNGARFLLIIHAALAMLQLLLLRLIKLNNL